MKNLLVIFTLSLPWQVAAFGASASDSAQAAVTVPIIGYAYDTIAHHINPIHGIPGAALIAAPISLPQDLPEAAISSELDYALVAGGGSAPAVLDLRSGATLSIPGVLPGPVRVVVSPTGGTAALYHSSDDLIEIVNGLPTAPLLARTIRTAGLPAQPAIFAISDDGQSLVVVPEENGRTLLSTDDGFIELPVPGPVAALAFSPSAKDLVIATHDGQIWFVKRQNGQTEYDLIGGGIGPVRTPTAMEFSRDGSRVFAAFTDGTIAAFDLAGNAPVLVSCGCLPVAFRRMKGDNLFLLQDSSGSLLRLFDVSRTAPRIFFIPASIEDKLQ